MKRLALLLIVLLAPPLRGQLLPPPQPKLFWRLNDLALLQEGIGTLQARVSGKTRSIVIPSGFQEVHATGDGFWANRRVGRNRARDIQIHFSPDGLHWHLQTTWPLRGQAPACRIFALRDRFLAVTSTAPFVQGESSSFFAVLKPGRGSCLVVDVLLPMEIGRNSPDWIFVPALVQIPEGWAVVHPRTGHVWLVTDAGEQVRIRKAKLYDAVKDEAIGSLGSVDPPILACQPTLDGRLLIAARSEEAVLKAGPQRKKAIQARGEGASRIDLDGIDISQPGPHPALEARLEAFERKVKAQNDAVEGPILERFPEVVWWELNPASGQFTKVAAPPGAPEELRTVEAYHRFTFRFDAKGRFVPGD